MSTGLLDWIALEALRVSRGYGWIDWQDERGSLRSGLALKVGCQNGIVKDGQEAKMDIDLVTRRRVLLATYQRYLRADLAWNTSVREAKTWFPSSSQPSSSSIGNPGSKVRRLYEQRKCALLKMRAARVKLEAARQRLAMRHGEAEVSQVFLLTYAAD